jgi:HAD superfamily hydrolase (TIGR01509 family)
VVHLAPAAFCGVELASPKLLIFDCDGVLIDSEIIACRVDAECLTEAGFSITADEVAENFVGVSSAQMFAWIEHRHGRKLPDDFPRTLKARLQSAFASELKPMPGVAQVLDMMPTARCVASSSYPDRLSFTLGHTGLLDYFVPHIFSATMVRRGKPAPDLFLYAAAQMGIEPRDCLVIEDSRAGVEAANAAGMRVLGFIGGAHCRPDHADRLRNAGANAIFSDMRELPRLLTT